MQVAASIYLALGPWAVLSFLKAEPAGLGFLGRLLFFHRGRLHFAQNLDTAIIVFLHNMLSLIPLTLLMAAKSSRHAAAENKKSLLASSIALSQSRFGRARSLPCLKSCHSLRLSTSI